ncbi:2,4-dienoyl-CoA reductase-like NADH-dependent reductase (Old Yellow Enzyme family)/thioredoxin reductase [Streptomyces sp. SAI-144]|nr:2,4-dienoyl-CoA reductase-like NADH-dependent reductase (Old Yellow Enzyme family)/thioredoxin reductase [Streptomyces sp. SAI-144]MDH6484314.1 2,4-dienoyl-CoA reductase-like NADH-dependent reductase (Old Yellow Enzyme family)/thioredoxin reductase [Streptomyces sp. SAI-127]
MGTDMTPGTDVTLATPFTLGDLTLRNRLVATAHAIAAVADGAPTDTDHAYWRRLARGGAGMVITGGTAVAPESTLPQRYLTEAWRPEIKDAVRRRAGAITEGGAVAIAQLVHLGRETLGAGTYYAPVSAAAVRSPREATAPHPLSAEEVRRVVDAFRVSAANSVQAGFHGVELHAGHGYLLAQFLSRVNNTRDDEYGDRIALLAQVIDAIRTEIGRLPIGVRLSVEPGDNSGLGLDDLTELLPRLYEASPFAYANVTTGVRNTYVPGMATTRPPLLESVARLRTAIAVPLLISQGFRSVADIERALDSGADLVGMARPFMADPDFARKVIAGDERSVRPCTGCNEGCRTFEPTGSCSVNPELAPPGATSRPAVPLLLTRRASGAGPVAVIGAGPAGMECAMALGRTGVEVVVFDRAREAGGQARLAALAAHRSGWQKLVAYQRDQLADLGVRVRLGASVTSAELAEYAQLVLATGAEETVVPVPGELPTLTSTDFLDQYADLVPRAPRVAVLDDGFGWWQGISAVESALAAGAREVTVVTPGTGFATGLSPENRTQLMTRLTGAPLRIAAMNTVTATTAGELRLRNVMDGHETLLAADLLVTVGERRPRRPDFTAADGQTVRAIGDCVVPRRIAHALAEGRAAAEAVAANLP